MSILFGDDNEEKKDFNRMIILCIAAVSFIVLLFLTVMYINSVEKKRRQAFEESLIEKKGAIAESYKAEEDDLVLNDNKIVSSDLDFWNMYTEKKEKKDTSSEEETKKQKINDFVYPDELTGDNGNDITDTSEENDEADLEGDTLIEGIADDNPESAFDDGKHIGITDKNGKKMWYEISDKLPKNTYDFKRNLTVDGQKFTYKSPQASSVFGIDVSKYQGEIDWEKVKASGVQFVMIRSAARGYGSGVLSIDDRFVEYMEGAKRNNIPIGVYVFSQAINEVEAVEEANFAVASVMNYNITYPIAIDVEEIDNDTARTDKLGVNERTSCVKTFCDTVKSYGFKPVIYASKEFLITKLNLDDLSSYDIWLRDTAGFNDKERHDPDTDFPYQFSMWQYSDSGTVNGINGSVDLNLSFVNYVDK